MRHTFLSISTGKNRCLRASGCLCFISALLFTGLSSCRVAEGDPAGLGEVEYGFEESLSSISSAGAGEVWIGTETGDVLLFDIVRGQKRAFDLKCDRIYFVASQPATGGDTILAVGMRNAGLGLWRANGECKSSRSFSIPVRGTCYSPYDFVDTGSGNMYVATSNGLYRINLFGPSDTMTLVYPDEKTLKAYNEEFEIKSFAVTPGCDTAVCATPFGLAVIPFDHPEEATVLLKNRKINYAGRAAGDGRRFNILSGRHKYILDSGSCALTDSVDCGMVPLICFDDAAGNQWVVSPDHMRIRSNYDNGYRAAGGFRDLPLRRRPALSERSGRRMILEDSSTGFIMMLSRNALSKMPSMVSANSAQRKIKAACTDGANNYFVSSDHKLYIAYNGGMVARCYCKLRFAQGENVRWIGSVLDMLYFCTEHHIYRMKVPSTKFLLERRPEYIGCVGPDDDIFTACLKSDEDHVDLLAGGRKALSRWQFRRVIKYTPVDSTYIESLFSSGRTNEPVYVATLHKGIRKCNYWGLKPSLDSMGALSAFSFARDVAGLKGGNGLCILTNQYIFCGDLDTGRICSDSVRAKGFRKLLVTGDSTFVALAGKGFVEYSVSGGSIVKTGGGIRYPSLAFEPSAAYFDPGTGLVLGSDQGAVVVDPEHQANDRWISFVDYEPWGLADYVWPVFVAILILLVFRVILYKGIEGARVRNEAGKLKRIITGFSDDECMSVDLKQTYDRLNEIIQHNNFTRKNINNYNTILAEEQDKVRQMIYDHVYAVCRRLEILDIAETRRLAKELDDCKNVERSYPKAIIDKVRHTGNLCREYEMLSATIKDIEGQINGMVSFEGICTIPEEDLKRVKDRFAAESRENYMSDLADLEKKVAELNSRASHERLSAFMAEMLDDEYFAPLHPKLIELLANSPDKNAIQLLRGLAPMGHDIEVCRVISAIGKCIRRNMISDRNRKELDGLIVRFFQTISEEERLMLYSRPLIKDVGDLGPSARMQVLMLVDNDIKPQVYVRLTGDGDGSGSIPKVTKSRIRAWIKKSVSESGKGDPEHGGDSAVICYLRKLAAYDAGSKSVHK